MASLTAHGLLNGESVKSNPFLIFSAEGTTIDLVKSVCNRLTKPVVLQIQRDVNAALGFLEQSPTVCVLADLGSATEPSCTLFLQKFRNLKGYSATHLVILAENIDPKLMVLGAEFAAFRLVSQPDRSSGLKDALEAVLADVSRPSGLRAALMKLSQAQRAGNIGEADRILEDCYQLYRDETDVLLEYGAMCIRKGKLDKAEKIAEKLSTSKATENDSLRVSNFLARVRLKQGNVGGALSILDRANLLSPDNLERLVLLGDVCRVRGEREKAEQSYKRVLELEPGHTSGKKGMGLVALSQGDANRALDFFRDCFTEEETGSFFNNTAVLAVRRKQFSKAEKLYSVAGEAFVDTSLRSKVAFNMGLMFRRWAKPDQALRKFHEAIALNPGYAKAADQLRMLGAEVPASLQDEDLGKMGSLGGAREQESPLMEQIAGLNSQVVGQRGAGAAETVAQRGSQWGLDAPDQDSVADRFPEPVSVAEFGLFDFADDELSGKGARVVETPIESEVARPSGSGIRSIDDPVRDVKPLTVESLLAQTRPRPSADRKRNAAGVDANKSFSQIKSQSNTASSKVPQGGQGKTQNASGQRGAKPQPMKRAAGGPAFIDDDDDDV